MRAFDDYINSASKEFVPENADNPPSKQFTVACRILPTPENKYQYIRSTESRSTSRLYTCEPRFDVRSQPRPHFSTVELDRVFGPECTGDEVYRQVAREMVQLSVDGGVGAVLMYGQTGSGKTFTTNQILQHLANDLFPTGTLTGLINEQDRAFRPVSVISMEFVGQTVRCLKTDTEIQIQEDQHRDIQINCAPDCETRVETHTDFLDFVSTCFLRRRTAATQRNETSSRSHAVVRITIQFTDRKSLEEIREPGVLFLVDLAGSERASDQTEHTPQLRAESRMINKSLMTLKECIIQRSRVGGGNQTIHIPFRQSRLTLLLKEFFEVMVTKRTKLATIACVSPLAHDMKHAINTLRYAQALLVSSNAKLVQVPSDDPKRWTRKRAAEFIQSFTRIQFNLGAILPKVTDGGRVLASYTLDEMKDRCVRSGMRETDAVRMYTKLSMLVCESKLNSRKIHRQMMES